MTSLDVNTLEKDFVVSIRNYYEEDYLKPIKELRKELDHPYENMLKKLNVDSSLFSSIETQPLIEESINKKDFIDWHKINSKNVASINVMRTDDDAAVMSKNVIIASLNLFIKENGICRIHSIQIPYYFISGWKRPKKYRGYINHLENNEYLKEKLEVFKAKINLDIENKKTKNKSIQLHIEELNSQKNNLRNSRISTANNLKKDHSSLDQKIVDKTNSEIKKIREQESEISEKITEAKMKLKVLKAAKDKLSDIAHHFIDEMYLDGHSSFISDQNTAITLEQAFEHYKIDLHNRLSTHNMCPEKLKKTENLLHLLIEIRSKTMASNICNACKRPCDKHKLYRNITDNEQGLFSYLLNEQNLKQLLESEENRTTVDNIKNSLKNGGLVSLMAISVASKYHTCLDCDASYIMHHINGDLLESIKKALDNVDVEIKNYEQLPPLSIYVSSTSSAGGERCASNESTYEKSFFLTSPQAIIKCEQNKDIIQ